MLKRTLPSLFLIEAASSCTKQTDTGNATGILSIFKMKHSTQTSSLILRFKIDENEETI